MIGTDVVTDPRKWQTLSRETGRVYLDRITRDPDERGLFGHFHVLPQHISPLRLYAYLRAKCGPPNGLNTFIRSNSVDNLIQWDFIVEDETFVLEFLGLNFRTECRLWAFVPFPEPDWDEFDATLATVLSEEAETIRKCISSFEKWNLFVNPYARLDFIASELEDELTKLTTDLKVFPSYAGSTPEGYARQMKSFTNNVVRLMTLSTVLQVIAPLIGEAAVNLVICVLAIDEIRKDGRLLEDCFRRNIDVRVKRLSIDCKGFARQVDQNREEFKDFMILMIRRNDTLHGNVDPKRAVGDPIYFDLRTIPLVENQKELSRFHYDHVTAGTSAEAALNDLQVARTFVEFLFSHLEPHFEKEFRLVAGELHLGYRPATGMLGRILPQQFVDFRIERDAEVDAEKWAGDGI